MSSKAHRAAPARDFGRPAREAPGARHRRDGWIIAGVLALSATVYLRCLGNGFVFDDHEMIVINRYIGNWSFLWKSLLRDSWWFRDPRHLPQSSYYRPLQDVWLGLNYQLFGLHAIGWHAAMIGLHLIAVALVFLVVRALTGDRIVAALTAMFFGLIAVHAEAVVWPSAVPLPMAADFELGALCLFVGRARSPRRGWIWAIVLYAGALLSHESAVAFPGLVAIYAFLLESPASRPLAGDGFAPEPIRPRLRRAALETAPFALEMVAYLGLRLWVLGFISRPSPSGHVAITQVLVTIPAAIANYLALLLFPWQAGPSHRFLLLQGVRSPQFYLAVIALAAITAAGALVLWERTRQRRLYAFCALWALIGLVPMMNLGGLYRYALIQDRYLYLPAMGICLIFADLIVALGRRGSNERRAAGAIAVALAVLYTACLWRVEYFWHDGVALFSECVREFPQSPIWHNRLGMALGMRGDLAGSARELAIAHRLDPTDGATLFDLGLAHERLGMRRQAATEMAAALPRLKDAPPGAYIGLAKAWEAAGDRAAMEHAYAHAAAMPGGELEVALARAGERIAARDGAGAEKMLAPFAGQNSGDPRLWSNLGVALALQGRYPQALEDYRRSLKLKPDARIHVLIGAALYKMGRMDGAMAQCRRALELDPRDRGARELAQRISGERKRR